MCEYESEHPGKGFGQWPRDGPSCSDACKYPKCDESKCKTKSALGQNRPEI